MTTVTLHGIAKKEFGENLKLEISSLKELCAAIDANRPGFIKKIKDLAAQGMHYAFIVNGEKIINLQKFPEKEKIKTIDVVPMIVGKGPLAPLIIPIISSAATGALGAAFAAGTIGAGTFILGSIAIGIGSLLLGQLFAPKADEPPGIESTTRALSQSFSFSNKANIAAQGTPVPVGYGELLVGSNIIQFSTKNFPQSYKSTEAFRQGQDGQSIPSVAKTPIFEEVNWPNTPPKQVFSWAQGMGVLGTYYHYFDPDVNNDGWPSTVAARWQPPSQGQVFGSVAVTIENDSDSDVLAMSLRRNESKLWPIGFDGWVDPDDIAGSIGTYIWQQIGDFNKMGATMLPGEKITHMLHGGTYVIFGKGDGNERLLANKPKPINEWNANPLNYRYRYDEVGTPVDGMTNVMCMDEYVIYVVRDGSLFNVFTKENILSEKRVVLMTNANHLWWNNVCQYPFTNSPFACYRYPYGDCNGRFCISNQAPRAFDSTLAWVRTTCTTDTFQGWIEPPPYYGANQSYAPCICEPSGAGPHLQINLREEGGSESAVSWSKIPSNQWDRY